MATTPQTRPAGPTATSERALGPDLARGFMLLFIALANSHYFLRGDTVRGGFPMDGTWLDSAVTWLIATFVDGRAFPMFGLLFGYGVAHIVRRNEALGPRGVRHLLWRRSLVLIVVGFLHAMLLYVGDILAAYGVLLLLGAWTVRWRARWLVLVAVAFFALGLAPSADSLSVSAEPPDASMLPPDLAAMFSERIVVQPIIMLFGPIGFACPFLIGLLAGRARVLEQPERHRRLLIVTAVAGIGVAVLGAQPAALMLAGVTDVPGEATLELIGPLHDAAGVLGGFGYAALIALVAARLTGRTGRITEAIRATGQRSMTCYLMQSVVWAAVFTPFLLDLSGTLTVTTTALLATATWLGTVAAADWMRRTGRRGPFEVLVRRVTYGPRRT
ncbi:DUF418 domain-containing protein [Jiangella alkaliphila]|uniref:Uncharacterized membrane protein YeiB n=1 Tax=Jiangella alkaliphila TaxID=419479 RepID=A0A1H2JJW8_9ACTN|nr:DUF418 domain-containing protein [Jiangella alkaliphila]SDU56657.1 Uncharacterized membrane protein YeiB [Jiangella alkaliphila]